MIETVQTLSGNVTGTSQTLSGTARETGIQGLSAYEVYVKNGGTLSEEEWLLSLKGETGEKGEKGDAGSVKFIIANELPSEDIDENAIYMIPSGETEDNTYQEYIYVNGAWESLGGASVNVDLTDYVKNTDYAKPSKAGVIKAGSEWGINVNQTTGLANIYGALHSDIDSRKQWFRPIVPSILDYAVKKALADCKLADTEYAWTDEEKANARTLIGAIDSTYKAAIGKLGLVTSTTAKGLYITESTGEMNIYAANESVIDARKSWHQPIVPIFLDHAIKSGLTKNALEWTDEEKASARALLGVDTAIANAITSTLEGSY